MLRPRKSKYELTADSQFVGTEKTKRKAEKLKQGLRETGFSDVRINKVKRKR